MSSRLTIILFLLTVVPYIAVAEQNDASSAARRAWMHKFSSSKVRSLI